MKFSFLIFLSLSGQSAEAVKGGENVSDDEKIFRYIIQLIQDFESELPDDMDVGIVIDGVIYPFGRLLCTAIILS